MHSLLESVRRRAEEGILTLTTEEYFDFFASVFEGYNVISFSVTSRIDPDYWFSPSMMLYFQRQVENIKKHSDGGPFRRIFLIDDIQLRDKYSRLFSIIREQMGAGIDVRALRLKINEKSTPWRPQDFGILTFSDGTKLGMYLDVDESGRILGGHVFLDSGHIALLESAFRKLWNASSTVMSEAGLFSLQPLDISEIYGNRCVGCMLDVEERLERGDWKHELSGRRVWYEINYWEGKALENVLNRFKPSRVLEVGVGTGRIINIVRSVLPNAEIIGYEQNAEIKELAQRRTGANILNIFVGREGNEFRRIPQEHEGYFDMVLAMANLVGWQDDEVEFIGELLRALRPGGALFFTVYRAGVELERMRMYRAEGDIVRLVNTDAGPQVQIVADYFHGEAHTSRSYTRERLEGILKKVGVPYEVFEVSKYHWGVILQKS